MGKKVHKAIERHKVESLARNWSVSALRTLGGIMTNPNSKDCDRIRAAEILRDWAWGKSAPPSELAEHRRLTYIVHEVVHVSMPREEPLAVEFHEVKTNGQMHEHDRG
jgi:hypothetical protein